MARKQLTREAVYLQRESNSWRREHARILNSRDSFGARPIDIAVFRSPNFSRPLGQGNDWLPPLLLFLHDATASGGVRRGAARLRGSPMGRAGPMYKKTEQEKRTILSAE